MSTQSSRPLYPKGSPPRRPETVEQGSSTSRQAKYVATACEACKKAKRKCDGDKPCQACREKKVQCVYDEAKDGRRGRKRALDELHAKGEALDVILDFIRTHDDRAVADLSRLIKTDASVDQITAQARTATSPRSRRKSKDRPRIDVMSIATMTDEPLVRVPARPWTNVTADDEFVSHLMTVYFTWHHESYPCVNRDIFLGAMQSGDLDSLYCSPFLVNCLLLTACLYSDHPLAFAYDRDSTTRGLHFADEVAKLWAEEEGRSTLALLQGLVALSMGFGFLKKDRQAMIYVRQLPIVCIELSRRVRSLIIQGHQEYTTDDYQRSMRMARWSAFAIEVDFSMIWVKPLGLAKPGAPRPGLYAARFDLREIGADILPSILSGDPDDSPIPGHPILDRTARMERLKWLFERLQTYRDDLPSYARIDVEAVPSWSLIELHLSWNDYHMTVCGLILADINIASSVREHTQSAMLESCRGIAELIEWSERSLGPTTLWCPWTFQSATMAAYALVDVLPEGLGIAQLLHVVIGYLSVAAKRWMLGRGVMKMLWIRLQERSLVDHLLPATAVIFRSSAVDSWTADDYYLFSGCMYPNYAAIGEKGRELADMGELLDQWSRLNVVDGEIDRKQLN
ncbi:Nitrogen assimilation transcription factor nit-4 [Cyphellophora attinorum]|uniref:Nitrogen assimilation transcription factor nit-4 n=1 Tax=Cyphellophora attinorum TaxID=1664694 RepID=A0A0N0NKJ3_9EURO|nr:Nitrogen assimilation transcription factor nit-4 [Phialophora attinorum]KPI38211.1 Nitrogen assimilation transcription factor nit-4 [Phialophora attinorum]